ncbi:MAG: hypothetical protein QF918_01135, partial [Pirellulaceae bacterium]|nr:hypothetical protein [Pirellulaceae bacterium]
MNRVLMFVCFAPLFDTNLHFLRKRLQLVSTKKGSSIMLRLQTKPHDRRAKDGELEMSLGMSGS